MSHDRIHRYRCHAIMDQNQQCGKPCWGETAYCRWHNASLTWQWFWEIGADSPHRIGAPSRALFDPEFAQGWKTATWATKRRFLFLLLIVLLAGGIFVLVPSFSAGRVIFALWGAGLLCIWWMANGNKSLLLPKLLVAVVLITTLVQYIEFAATARVVTIKIILQFGYLIGVFLMAVPILSGPLVERSADITDREALPPTNCGDGCLKVLGFSLIGLSIISFFLM